jgi:hypothetical protein
METIVEYAYKLAENGCGVKEIADVLYNRYDPFITYEDVYDIANRAVADTKFVDFLYWGPVLI